MTDRSRICGVILAAGSASRFGSNKLLADLDGRPVLQHVVDRIARLRLGKLVVVVRDETMRDAADIAWRGATVVVNHDARAGMSTSLRAGVAAVPGECDAALILLGDQPSVSEAAVQAILETDLAGAVAAVPVYDDAVRGHPVLLARAGFGLVDEAEGDRGLAPLLAERPQAVVEVGVAGNNPDVDTPTDLARLAAASGTALVPEATAAEQAWANRVLREREQVERLREIAPAEDFYEPIRSVFVADPRRTDDPVLDALLALGRPDDSWLDVGAGAGRYALPIALASREVIAVEPSPAMRGALERGAIEHGIRNIRTLPDRWPMPNPPRADVALVAHLGYDVAEIGPFLDALESAARRLCVAVMMERPPNSAFVGLWQATHGEGRAPLPALPELLALLLARGRLFEVRLSERERRRFESRDSLRALARHQLFVREGSEADQRLNDAIEALPVETDGSVVLAAGPRWIGVVSWTPPDARSSG